MTTVVRDEYLLRLGFQRTKEKKFKNKLNSTNTQWVSSDGNWERRVSMKEAFSQVSVNPQTLAGQVETKITKKTSEELDETWRKFKAHGKMKDRDQLIVFYSPLVKYVASRVAAGLPQSVDQADLVSYGMFGLIDAINKFDLDRGFKFETYAITRIKGSILDELRSIDWIPRSIRSKAKSVERAMTKLESKFHRNPTDEEIADEMGLSMNQLHNLFQQISSLGIVALDEIFTSNGKDNLTYGDTLADRRDGPSKSYDDLETRQLLANAINTMSERERIVLTLYYYEGLTLSDIGDVLNVTESRVCQIHTKAVLQLRSKLAADTRELNK